jgi:hypothetical protein
MTGFTSNPIIDMKAQTTIVRGNVVRMTIQADIRLMRVFQSKFAGDSAGFVIQQRQVGVGVAIMLGPGAVFVQQHIRLLSLQHTPMANSRGAGGRTEVIQAVMLRQGSGMCRH